MSSWLLLGFLIVVWLLWGLAAAADKGVEDARRGVPRGQHRGVSLFPVIPVFPLALWGIALVLDRFTAVGTLLMAGLHAAYAVVLGASFLRNLVRLRRIEAKARGAGPPP